MPFICRVDSLTMLKMFRRKRREGDLQHSDRTALKAEVIHHFERGTIDSSRKVAEESFELLPVTRDSNGIVRGSLRSTANNIGKPYHTAPPPESTALVSFIHFKDVIHLSPASSSGESCPRTPALVYTAGGKAKSMYTVARPISLRKFRDSTISQPDAASAPSTRVPPVPALKLPSVKARHKQIPTFNVCVA